MEGHVTRVEEKTTSLRLRWRKLLERTTFEKPSGR
jgi:hypothetical protein